MSSSLVKLTTKMAVSLFQLVALNMAILVLFVFVMKVDIYLPERDKSYDLNDSFEGILPIN